MQVQKEIAKMMVLAQGEHSYSIGDNSYKVCVVGDVVFYKRRDPASGDFVEQGRSPLAIATIDLLDAAPDVDVVGAAIDNAQKVAEMVKKTTADGEAAARMILEANSGFDLQAFRRESGSADDAICRELARARAAQLAANSGKEDEYTAALLLAQSNKIALHRIFMRAVVSAEVEL